MYPSTPGSHYIALCPITGLETPSLDILSLWEFDIVHYKTSGNKMLEWWFSFIMDHNLLSQSMAHFSMHVVQTDFLKCLNSCRSYVSKWLMNYFMCAFRKRSIAGCRLNFLVDINTYRASIFKSCCISKYFGRTRFGNPNCFSLVCYILQDHKCTSLKYWVLPGKTRKVENATFDFLCRGQNR